MWKEVNAFPHHNCHNHGWNQPILRHQVAMFPQPNSNFQNLSKISQTSMNLKVLLYKILTICSILIVSLFFKILKFLNIPHSKTLQSSGIPH